MNDDCTHGHGCVECEKRRLEGITAEAVQAIRRAIPSEELTSDEEWNYGEAELGATVAGYVFEAVKEAARFPDLSGTPLY